MDNTSSGRERITLDLGDLLSEIQVPDMGDALAMFSKEVEERKKKEEEKKRSFGKEEKRKAWDKSTEARCDFYPKRRLVRRAGLYFFALWQKSIMGRTLTEIKSDSSEIEHFAKETADMIKEIIGDNLGAGKWSIVTTPKRRHLTKNFATLIAEEIGKILHIPFYEDVASCRTKQRVNAIFDLHLLPPEPNIIVFDDFVTTGSTLHSMKVLLEAHGKNLMFFTGINNKL